MYGRSDRWIESRSYLRYCCTVPSVSEVYLDVLWTREAGRTHRAHEISATDTTLPGNLADRKACEMSPDTSAYL